MKWDNIQNFLPNIVLGIFLVIMILYWINVILFKKTLTNKSR